MKRASGILLPVFSLPSEHGIGCFSKEAYQFVDMLKKAGQSYWQILPLGPTGYGDSPYQSFSTFAGNPYFIDLAALADDIATMMQPVVADGGRTLTLETSPVAEIVGDRQLLGQMLVNLIENALRHTPPGTRIEIGVTTTGKTATLTVTDTGPGIPADVRPRRGFQGTHTCKT